jgi:hypothetical protein
MHVLTTTHKVSATVLYGAIHAYGAGTLYEDQRYSLDSACGFINHCKIQRRTTTWILKTKQGDIPYQQRLIALNLPPLCYDREIKLVRIFLQGAIFGHLDFNVYHFVSFINNDHTRLRKDHASLTLKVPFCKTRTFQASYFNRIVKLWNTTCKIPPPLVYQVFQLSNVQLNSCIIFLILIKRVHRLSCVVAPAIGHKLTSLFLWEVLRMRLGVPFELFPFGFFCCYFKISVSLSNYLLI